MSVFSDRPATEHVAANALAFAIRDGFPVSPGHTLVVPFREVATWWEATRAEQLAILELVEVVKAALDAELGPHGYNVGFNAGPAAGQTVMHLHVHVIPRFVGDVPDPRGGVRHVVAGKGNYLAASFRPAETLQPRRGALATGGADDPLLGHLRPLLRGALGLDVVAAFVQERGLLALAGPLAALATDAPLRLLTGDYLEITQADALRRLLDWQQGAGPGSGPFRVRVVQTAALATQARSFHPKAWIVRRPGGEDVAFVGSSNLSRAALTDGLEWNLRLQRRDDAAGFLRVTTAFEALWASARPLDADFVAAYAARARAALPHLGQAAASTRDEASIGSEVDVADANDAPPAPHEVQAEALAALVAARAEGRSRALVVFATGMGKTWLAAFDFAALAAELGRLPRLLVGSALPRRRWGVRRRLGGAFGTARAVLTAGAAARMTLDAVLKTWRRTCWTLGSGVPRLA